MVPKTEKKAVQEDSFTLPKIKWSMILLLIIIIFGFYLRLYHIGYPVIGYHNWKETHYLTEARSFAREGFFQYGFFAPYTDYPIGPDPSGIHPDTFPLPQIIIALLFKIFGISLLLARIVPLLFSVATILVIYLLAKELFKREDFALVSALLFAINPLFIFFGRYVMLDSAALFFMLLSGYLFLRWKENDQGKYLILTSVFLTLATLTKYTYFIIGIPMLLSFPFSRLKEWRQRLKTFLPAALIPLLVPIWILYMTTIPGEYGLKEAASGETVRFGTLTDSEFWMIMKSYAADNYTLIGVVLSFIGLALLLLSFRKSEGHRFLAYYFIGVLGWFFVLSYKLSGHSYHQYPIAPLFIFAVAYLFVLVGSTIQKLVKFKFTSIVVILLLFALIWSPSVAAKNRQFDTQFFGLDVAGDYIKEHSNPDELVFHSGHQSYGLHWSADRKGSALPAKVQDIKAREAMGASWILIYQWGFQVTQNQEVWKYIKDNYELRQIAFMPTQGGNQPIYLLLKKGGSFDEDELNKMLEGKPLMTKDYELTGGTVRINYINLE